ncbi:uncharacterized protein LOC127843833 isoform X2 [Dreissena polymorpha]|uniref:Uncharacterized protein n=1 Tax=Dreissena polymorpha TaxID=45954 RepID=A0A9D4IIR2_DREPO|nr:uncharacterized protein LOC127843833 isoform X2 [Dreissena polymorpha]KAH3775715.1 hypothetical protein DPMN_177120 [Dreissena polymorpha]
METYPGLGNCYLFCSDSLICYGLNQRCDGIKFCPQGDDELFCGYRTDWDNFKISTFKPTTLKPEMSWVDDQNNQYNHNNQYGMEPSQSSQDATPLRLGGGEITGIIVGVVFFVVMMLVICCWAIKRRQERLEDARPLVTNIPTTPSMQRLPTQGSTQVAIQPGYRLAAAQPGAPATRGALGLIIVRRVFCIASVARAEPAVPVSPPPYETLGPVTTEMCTSEGVLKESDSPPPYRERY